MAFKPPPPWEFLHELVGGSDVTDEVNKSVRSLAQSALSRMEMVSREEFDAQVEILHRTRARVVALEAALEALTREMESLSKGS